MRLVLTTALALTAAVLPLRPQDPAPHKVRIGTYDNRCIAIAFAASAQNPVAEKMKEHAAAKEAGDDARVAELEAWGQRSQRALHRQGFGRVPVDDLLASVADRLPGIAEARDLDAIAWFTDYTDEGVELVDVTDDLVALFDPSEKVLAWVRQTREHAPVDLDEIEAGQDH